MKKILAAIAFFCFSFCAWAQPTKWFSIKAFLPQWNGAEIGIFRDNELLYSDKVRNDIFTFNGAIDAPDQALLKISLGKKSFYMPFFMEPGTIKIRDAGGKALVPYGTPSNDLYLELNKRFDSIVTQQNNFRFSEALSYKRHLASDFIHDNPSSIVSVQLLKDYYYLVNEADDSLYYSLAHCLDTGFRQFSYVKEMLKEAGTRYATAVGQPAPFAQLFDGSGRKTSLFEKGQYTLIDFWASWCVPCRKENPALIKIFKKYQGTGFTISGVSLDVNKNRWLNAIRQDQLSWPQFSDLKGWESTVVHTYGIKLIPMNYLINRDGMIIAKNLNAAQLDDLLSTILLKGSTGTTTETKTLFRN